MEWRNKIIVHTNDCHKDDKTRIKEEHINQDEIPTESQKFHLLQNDTYFVECHESSELDTKIRIKQENWAPNVVLNNVKSDPEELPTCLGAAAIKGAVEIYFKEEPPWCDTASTDLNNEEKESESDKHEVPTDTLSLESPRLPTNVVYPDATSVTFLDVEKDAASNSGKDVCHGTSIRQDICLHNSNPTCDSNHFESELNLDDESSQGYKCEICEKLFARKSNLMRHKLTHSGTKPYSCDICEKCFSQKSTLQNHKLLHVGTKPYKCDICEKYFTQKIGLERHRLIHSGTKPYKCDSCEKYFTQKLALQRHTWVHTGTIPYSCDICEKRFTRKSTLQIHKLLHSGTKPYKCDICEKCFTKKSTLECHKLLHSGTTPYKCDRCEKYFTQKVGLQRHALAHSGTKPYKCDRCETYFTQEVALQRHTLAQHRTIVKM